MPFGKRIFVSDYCAVCANEKAAEEKLAEEKLQVDTAIKNKLKRKEMLASTLAYQNETCTKRLMTTFAQTKGKKAKSIA